MKEKDIARQIGRAAEDGKKILEKAWGDPLVQEYVGKQKKLAKSTLRKAIRRVEKKIGQ